MRGEGRDVGELAAVEDDRHTDEDDGERRADPGHEGALIAPDAGGDTDPQRRERQRPHREDRGAVPGKLDADEHRQQEDQPRQRVRRAREAADDEPRHERDREGGFVVVAADPDEPVLKLRTLGQMKDDRK